MYWHNFVKLLLKIYIECNLKFKVVKFDFIYCIVYTTADSLLYIIHSHSVVYHVY